MPLELITACHGASMSDQNRIGVSARVREIAQSASLSKPEARPRDVQGPTAHSLTLLIHGPRVQDIVLRAQTIIRLLGQIDDIRDEGLAQTKKPGDIHPLVVCSRVCSVPLPIQRLQRVVVTVILVLLERVRSSPAQTVQHLHRETVLGGEECRGVLFLLPGANRRKKSRIVQYLESP